MNEREKITVVSADGSERVGEVLLDIHLESTNKDYVLYTFNEVDEHDLETVYASTIEVRDGEEVLADIATDEEWAEIKKIMKKTIKKNQQSSN